IVRACQGLLTARIWLVHPSPPGGETMTSVPKKRQSRTKMVKGLWGWVVATKALSTLMAWGIDRVGQAFSNRNSEASRMVRVRYWAEAIAPEPTQPAWIELNLIPPSSQRS